MSDVAFGQARLAPESEQQIPTGDPAVAGNLTQLRDDTCATLHTLDETAKARARVVRSCAEMQGLSVTEVEALKDLLRCITDQRKRMRALRRLWQSLDSFERPSADLVEATDLCFSECRELSAALDPLSAQATRQAQCVTLAWTRLLTVAAQFTAMAGL